LQLVNGGGVKIYVNTRRPVVADPGVQDPPVDILLPGVGCQLTIHCLSKKETGEHFWAEYVVWSYDQASAAVVSSRSLKQAYTSVEAAMFAEYHISEKGADWTTIFVNTVAVQHYLERAQNAGIAFRKELSGMEDEPSPVWFHVSLMLFLCHPHDSTQWLRFHFSQGLPCLAPVHSGLPAACCGPACGDENSGTQHVRA